METGTLIGIVLTAGSLLFLIGSMVRSIQNESRSGASVLKDFGLSISLLLLFLGSWVGHGLSQWDDYVQTQEEHQQPVEVSGYVTEFMQASLENWQSEFLQLFSFVVLAALYIHKGSAESKDGDEEIRAALKRIEKKLDKGS
jgi:hypothetical protein